MKETYDFDVVSGLTIPFSNGWIVIYVNDNPKLADEMLDTIIHESVHVFQFAMDYIGQKDPGIEVEAYTIAHIASSLIKEYSQQTAQQENENSLHDQREKGLQKRESAVQLEAGTNQEQDSPDDSTSSG